VGPPGGIWNSVLGILRRGADEARTAATPSRDAMRVGSLVLQTCSGGAMKLSRRRFLSLAAGAATLPTLSPIARAQAYPTRPARILVGFAAGGAVDVTARLMGQWLSDRLGQQFIVENRTGAGSNIATEAVVRAAPDGYTLLLVAPANAVNATLYDKINFNFIRDITPVASIIRESNVMLVHTSVPAKTVPEFIAYAKANPDKVTMASPGNGSSGHLSGELFKMMAGVNMIHVPYRGGAPAITDLLSGQVQVYFGATSASVEHIKSGKLRALAVTTATRSEALPDIPVLNDFLPGYEASFWAGIGVPKNTPTEIVDTLNREINAGLSDSKMKARLAEQGGTVLALSPSEFGNLIAEETEKWAKVIRFAGIKPE
jgi:tripartite-type tricarboxylate transporter receptor subunit TctC